MANWTVSASTPTATAQTQLYASEVWREARVNSFWNAFMGEGPNNVIQIRRDFVKSKGDALNYNLVADLSQKGLAGSGLQSLLYFGSTAATRRLEGNEEAPNVYTDSVLLDQLRHAVITGGKLSEQRLAFEMRPEMKNNLAYWYARIAFDEVIFKKLSGVTFTDSQSRTLGEAAVANTNNIYGGNKTASNQLTSGDTFEPTLFRKAKEAAMTGVGTVNASNVANATIWKIRPMIIGGKPYYGCVLHPYCVYDLQGSQAWEQAHREISGLREHNDKSIVVVKLCELGGTPNVILQPRAIPNQVLLSKEVGKV